MIQEDCHAVLHRHITALQEATGLKFSLRRRGVRDVVD